MREAFTADQVRAAERPLLEAGVPLMGHAAFAIATRVTQQVRLQRGMLAGARIVVLVGPGNNGGDALFAAAHLAKTPLEVTAVLLSPQVHTAGLAALRRSPARVVPWDQDATREATAAWHHRITRTISQADAVVDGVLGIGSSGAVRGPACHIFAELNHRVANSAPRPQFIAVDVPSGVNASTGEVLEPDHTFPADLTLTCGVAKTGLLVAPGALFAGDVDVIDLGLTTSDSDVQCVELRDFRHGDFHQFVGLPAAQSHKYTRGVVSIDAGSPQYPGAGVLASRAAAACGIGMVRYVGDSAVGSLVHQALPEAVTDGGRVQARLIGSGQTPQDDVREAVLRAVADREVPVVLDAGALAVLDAHMGVSDHVVLTPHAGELADLLTAWGEPTQRVDVEDRPLAYARRAQALTGAVVVLKGPTPVIAGPQHTFVQPRMGGVVSRLATAGSGDVLAGVVTAMLARAESERDVGVSVSVTQAAAVAVFLHQCAALTGGGRALIASDLVDAIPHAMAVLCAPPSPL